MSTFFEDIGIESANADIPGKVAATRDPTTTAASDATRVQITTNLPKMLCLPPFCFPGFDLDHHHDCDRGCFPDFGLDHRHGCDRGWLACCGSRTLEVSPGKSTRSVSGEGTPRVLVGCDYGFWTTDYETMAEFSAADFRRSGERFFSCKDPGQESSFLV